MRTQGKKARVFQGLGRGLAVAALALAAAGPGLASGAAPQASVSQGTAALAFPGAQGWAAHTPGGRGGRIIRVTTLAASGPGSFAEALAASGPRIVVFEVGGVIDLGMKELRITEPFLTIAGQTAPQPGITFIRGGLTIATHDVVVRHIRMRPGDGDKPKWSGDIDAITTVRGARDVIVDHCSLTWATDENLSASSTRFLGESEQQWMEAASRRITYSNNIIAEGLANATHAKGEHSKGSLIHDHVNDMLIVGNLYAHNYERNPLFKGGARGQVINNLIYDPGQRARALQPDRRGMAGPSVLARPGGGARQRDARRHLDRGGGVLQRRRLRRCRRVPGRQPRRRPPRRAAAAAGPLHDHADQGRCAQARAGAAVRRDRAAVGAGAGRGDRQRRRAPVGPRRRRPPHPRRHHRRPRPHHRQPGSGRRLSEAGGHAAGRSCRPTGTWTRWSR